MKTALIITGIVIAAIIVILAIMYILATVFLNKSFSRLDFIKGNGLISFDDIKDKYERDEYEFKSGKNTLKAYMYKGTKEDDLIVYVHGMCPGHQGYLSDIMSLVDRGYNIFTYDFTATGNSDGKHYSGIDHQLFDLRCAMAYLENNNYFGYKNIYLYGHSMGGYAVAAYDNDAIKAKVSISGFDNPIHELLAALGVKNKLIKAFISFMVRFKYFMNRGFKYNLKAHKMLKNTNTYTLVIHGANDKLVPYDNISICSKKDLINNDKVEYLKMEEELHSEHNTVIASTDCVLYQREIEKLFEKEKAKGKSPAEARDIMFKSIDIFKFNKANEDLMDIIDKFYQSHK